ncbi:helix-turn-helix domain-containing protein [Burkholderia cepacia]|uniref:helix-turn-helix domain-containing protein n=1 Tax=Burkholderia cepacia TaxID=292 RepID=UPI003EDF64DD
MGTYVGALRAAKDESVFVGDDWVVYIGSPGDFARSEMLTPCLLTSVTAGLLRICADGSEDVVAETVLHPSGVWSKGVSAAVAILYLDPVSDEGRAVQQFCGTKPVGLSLDSGLRRAAMNLGGARVAEVVDDTRSFVNALRAALRDSLPPQSVIDRRLLRVAAQMADHATGRLHLSNLTETAGFGTDHLRQCFRQATGMTLSRYQMWLRLHSMLVGACMESGSRQKGAVDRILQDAGFYDTSHCSRAVRRYFGMRALSTSARTLGFIDCRQAT